MLGSTKVMTSGPSHICLIKIDNAGNLTWAKSFGDTSIYSNDYGYEVQLTSDSGYVVIGQTTFAGYPIGSSYIIKTDKNGIAGCNENDLILYDSSITPSIAVPTFSISTGITSVSATIETACGCATETTFCSGTVGVNNIVDSNTFLVYPNPFVSAATINFNKEYENGQIKVFDLLGEEVNNITFSGTEAEIKKGTLKAGIYFLYVMFDNILLGRIKICIQ